MDNAVDACAPPFENRGSAGASEATKRVRVTMTIVKVPKRPATVNHVGATDIGEEEGAGATMECLR